MKAIYKPAGKAAEYAEWACNFYVGCSNGCEYCYLRKGRGAKVLGGDRPTLKKCFRDEAHALETFEKELKANLSELQKSGLFFSFTTDPMLYPMRINKNDGFYYTPNVSRMTGEATQIAVNNNVPVKILTKCADFAISSPMTWPHFYSSRKWLNLVAFGFTLTGHDDLEPGASTNAERIEAMKRLHEAGFKTFASIEPIIDYESSLRMLWSIRNICDLAKIGLEGGRKHSLIDLRTFIGKAIFWADGNNRSEHEMLRFKGFKLYFKDSLLKQAKVNRTDLPDICVMRDYDLFR